MVAITRVACKAFQFVFKRFFLAKFKPIIFTSRPVDTLGFILAIKARVYHTLTRVAVRHRDKGGP